MSRIFWCLFFTFWPIVAIVVCAIAPAMDWSFPGNREAATPLGQRIDDLFYLILGIVTVAFIGTMGALAYVLWKTLAALCEKAGLGHEPRRVLEELSQIHSIDVVLPTRDNIEIRKRCVTKPTDHQAILLHHLGLNLPSSLRQTEI